MDHTRKSRKEDDDRLSPPLPVDARCWPPMCTICRGKANEATDVWAKNAYLALGATHATVDHRTRMAEVLKELGLL